jgi:CRISPR/Cas system-associated protein Csx1
LYYATFYACRALLALDDVCIFYVRTKPFCLKCVSGKTPTRKNDTTHKVVLNEFQNQQIVPRLFSQTIEYKDPLEWLMDKREDSNYRFPKFQEPNVPKYFEKIISSGIRTVLTTYLQDSSDIYTFDADHAMVAYPLKTLQYAYSKLKTFNHLRFEKNDTKYLCGLFRDNNGPIPEVFKMIKLE